MWVFAFILGAVVAACVVPAGVVESTQRRTQRAVRSLFKTPEERESIVSEEALARMDKLTSELRTLGITGFKYWYEEDLVQDCFGKAYSKDLIQDCFRKAYDDVIDSGYFCLDVCVAGGSILLDYCCAPDAEDSEQPSLDKAAVRRAFDMACIEAGLDPSSSSEIVIVTTCETAYTYVGDAARRVAEELRGRCVELDG